MSKGIKQGSRVYVLLSADLDVGGRVGEVVGFLYSDPVRSHKPVVSFADGTMLGLHIRHLLELPEPKAQADGAPRQEGGIRRAQG